jgi:hypothetical protein
MCRKHGSVKTLLVVPETTEPRGAAFSGRRSIECGSAVAASALRITGQMLWTKIMQGNNGGEVRAYRANHKCHERLDNVRFVPLANFEL